MDISILDLSSLNTSLLLMQAGVAFASAIAAGMTGVGGALIMVPGLALLGMPATVAITTGSVGTIVTKASGAFAHYKRGNVDYRAFKIVLIVAGLTTAVCAGGFSLYKGFASPETSRELELLLKSLVGYVVAISAAFVIKDLMAEKWATLDEKSLNPLSKKVEGQISYRLLKWLSLIPGVTVGFTGVGGGAINVPNMLISGMKASTAAGTGLAVGTVLSALTGGIYAIFGGGLDMSAIIVMVPAVLFGTWLGAKLSSVIPDRPMKWTILVILGVLIVKMIVPDLA